MERIKQFVSFLFLEIIGKSLLICVLTTFVVSLLLAMTPMEKGIKVRIREKVVDDPKTTQMWTNTCFICHKTRIEQKAIEIVSTNSEYKENLNFIDFYLKWIGDIIRGEAGRGKAGQRITEEVGQKFPVTFTISFASVIPALSVSFLIGLLRHRRWITTVGGIIYLFTTLPAFFLGYLLIGFFGFNPSSILNYLLAILTLGLSSGIINEMVRVINNAMSIELSRDYIETAKAKGLSEEIFPRRGTIGFHAFRNALITIVPRIGSLFAFIISGSMIVEQVFNLPGLSFMLFDGMADNDRTRVLIVILLSMILVRMGTIMSNFCYLLLNPRYGQR